MGSTQTGMLYNCIHYPQSRMRREGPLKRYLWPAALLLVSACATNQPASSTPVKPATAGNAALAITAAEVAVKRAEEVGFAWRDSEALITQAKNAAVKKKYAKAMKLARRAECQGSLAYQQYLDQQKQND